MKHPGTCAGQSNIIAQFLPFSQCRRCAVSAGEAEHISWYSIFRAAARFLCWPNYKFDSRRHPAATRHPAPPRPPRLGGDARIDVLLPSPPIIRYPLIPTFLSERASSAACRRMASVSNESCQFINELSHWPWQVLAGSWVWCLCLELSAWVYITISHYELLLSIQFRSVISADMFANSQSKEGKNGSIFYITRPAFMVWYYFRFFVYLKF